MKEATILMLILTLSMFARGGSSFHSSSHVSSHPASHPSYHPSGYSHTTTYHSSYHPSMSTHPVYKTGTYTPIRTISHNEVHSYKSNNTVIYYVLLRNNQTNKHDTIKGASEKELIDKVEFDDGAVSNDFAMVFYGTIGLVLLFLAIYLIRNR